MRRYDDPVEVRKGLVHGTGGDVEAPEQFLWRGRLWKVCDVVGHWVETGPWWQSPNVAPVLGAEDGNGSVNGWTTGSTADSTTESTTESPERSSSVHDLVAEREVWRVEAARGLVAAGAGPGAGRGVFDLVFDWAEGGWLLTRCAD
jgi:hypothetical protein